MKKIKVWHVLFALGIVINVFGIGFPLVVWDNDPINPTRRLLGTLPFLVGFLLWSLTYVIHKAQEHTQKMNESKTQKNPKRITMIEKINSLEDPWEFNMKTFLKRHVRKFIALVGLGMLLGGIFASNGIPNGLYWFLTIVGLATLFIALSIELRSDTRAAFQQLVDFFKDKEKVQSSLRRVWSHRKGIPKKFITQSEDRDIVWECLGAFLLCSAVLIGAACKVISLDPWVLWFCFSGTVFFALVIVFI